MANQEKLINQHSKAELEKRLAHQDKLDSLSTMSAGVMHDFNNYLLAIIGEAELGMNQPKTKQMIENFEHIMESAQLASGLTKDLSNYIGAGKLNFCSRDLNQELLNARPILNSVSNSRIQLRYDESTSIPVSIDPSAFRNVLINLVKNAAEASPDKRRYRDRNTTNKWIKRESNYGYRFGDRNANRIYRKGV